MELKHNVDFEIGQPVIYIRNGKIGRVSAIQRDEENEKIYSIETDGVTILCYDVDLNCVIF